MCIFKLFLLLKRFQEWLNSNSELTPSETVETFEDDESEVENSILVIFFPIHIIMTPCLESRGSRGYECCYPSV